MIHLRIGQADDKYPQTLNQFLENRAPNYIFAIGDLDLLRQETVALFCSVKCPGNLILKTYDLARQVRDAGTAVISGFHSRMEKERGWGQAIVTKYFLFPLFGGGVGRDVVANVALTFPVA